MKEQLIARWLAFSQKEQFFLKILSFFLLCALFYALVWLPLQQGRIRLERVIPEKKAKLTLMRSQAQDIERLRGQLKFVNNTNIKSIVEISAKLNAITPVYPQNSTSTDKQIEITLTQVNFDTWIKWLDSLQSQYHIRVKFCQVLPSPSRGLVNINAVLAASE